MKLVVAQGISFPRSNSNEEIITKLYNGTWNRVDGECIWQPNKEEKELIGIKDDGFAYTRLHKVLKYKTSKGEYTVLFTVNYYKENGEIPTYHYVSPSVGLITLFNNVQKMRTDIVSFDKHLTNNGSWGTPGEISLLQIGKDYYFIKLESGYTNQGYTEVHTDLYFQGNLMLTFNNDSNEGAILDPTELYGNSTSITTDISQNKIILHKDGTELVEKNGKSRIVEVDEKSVYYFNGKDLVPIDK